MIQARLVFTSKSQARNSPPMNLDRQSFSLETRNSQAESCSRGDLSQTTMWTMRYWANDRCTAENRHLHEPCWTGSWTKSSGFTHEALDHPQFLRRACTTHGM